MRFKCPNGTRQKPPKSGKCVKTLRARSQNNTILYSVTGMPDDRHNQFRVDYAFSDPSSLTKLFITDVNGYKEEEPEDETILTENVKIYHIRGLKSKIIYSGDITKWTPKQIKQLMIKLKLGDRIRVEI